MSAGEVRELLDRWERRAGAEWTGSAAGYRDLARDALALGHPILASEVLREALATLPPDPELRYLAALAHARIGSWREAASLVSPLLEDPSVPPAVALEARSLAGRIAKDRWARTAPGAERDRLGAEALAHYRLAWEETRDPFPGINAATLALLTGAVEDGRAIARDVRSRTADAEPPMEALWRAATLGEAAVLLEAYEEAELRYREAVAAAGRHVGHVAAMRRQLQLIARHRPVPASVLDALAQPAVVAFVAPAMEAGGTEAAVAAQIREALDRLGAGFGYSSAAAGADLLFVEAMLERDAEVHILLPFERGDFVKARVEPAGPEWVERFDRALAEATTVTYAVREGYLGDEALFGYAQTLLRGAAILRARQLATEPVMLAVADSGIEAGSIDLSGPPSAVAVRATGLRRSVKTMLFADVVGFSKLHEEETPAFLVEFLGTVAEILAAGTVRPDFVNTWGDGLFMVFDDVAVGADAAMRLRDKVLQTDWPARGLPSETSLRVGMHSGPVFPADDPLIGRANFFGSHVNRAARIEPVTAPGAVYVSEAMACLLAASGGDGFATDYLGTVPLAKGFDTSPLYRLRRADAAE